MVGGLKFTGHRPKVREFKSKRISDFRLRLRTSFIRLYPKTGDTLAHPIAGFPSRYNSLTFALSPVVKGCVNGMSKSYFLGLHQIVDGV